MKQFHTIESWASSVGYVVESESGRFFWQRENEREFRSSDSIEKVIDMILLEIKESYKGGE
jgi:hypothetical protein